MSDFSFWVILSNLLLATRWTVLLSLIAWGAEGVALYLIIVGFDVSVSLPLCVFFYATATLAGALVPVPGGLGVTEAMIQDCGAQLAGKTAAEATALLSGTIEQVLVRLGLA